MKGGSVLAHVTDWNDEADEESAPFCRAKTYFLLFLPQNGCDFEKARNERRERAGARDRLE